MAVGWRLDDGHRKTLDLLVIDEGLMSPEEFYAVMELMRLENPSMMFLFVACEYQLPPVRGGGRCNGGF